MTKCELEFELPEMLNVSVLFLLRLASLDGKTIDRYWSPMFTLVEAGSGVELEAAGMNATRFLLMPAPNTL